MTRQPLIKICGITDASLAAQTIGLGVDMIGVVFHPASCRHISEAQAQTISQAVHQAGGQIVGVFVDQDAAEITRLAKSCQLDYVQLHGTTARQAANTIELAKIIAVAVGSPTQDFNVSAHDFILYDNPTPGSGERFDDSLFKPGSTPFFIAGGVNMQNVCEIIKQYRPTGIDVSSGVESSRGVKDKQLIADLIKRIRTC